MQIRWLVVTGPLLTQTDNCVSNSVCVCVCVYYKYCIYKLIFVCVCVCAYVSVCVYAHVVSQLLGVSGQTSTPGRPTCRSERNWGCHALSVHSATPVSLGGWQLALPFSLACSRYLALASAISLSQYFWRVFPLPFCRL